jgi:hypothetical protein
MIKGERLTKLSSAVNFPIGIRAAGQARILTLSSQSRQFRAQMVVRSKLTIKL